MKKLFLYEPPFIVDDSHAPIPDSLQNEIVDAVAANKRGEAVGLFFRKGMGIPPAGVTFMRLLMPAWRDMAAIVHTAPYDLKILEGTQSGKPRRRIAGLGQPRPRWWLSARKVRPSFTTAPRPWPACCLLRNTGR